MSGIPYDAQICRDVADAAWTHAGRSTVGFVRIQDGAPASLGSGTLIKFGNVAGILTCAHVLEALLKETEIGILCFPVRASQIQTLRLPIVATDSIMIGTPPWSEAGPDLGFLRLPASIRGDIERIATIANGDLHRQNIVAGEPTPSRKFCVIVGVVDEFTEPPIITEVANGIVTNRRFEALINIGHVLVENENADRFRFQPISSQGAILPQSYKGTSGGGLWLFFLGEDDFSVLQARPVGVAYWEKLVGQELHIVGHTQVSIYDTLFNAVQRKW